VRPAGRRRRWLRTLIGAVGSAAVIATQPSFDRGDPAHQRDLDEQDVTADQPGDPARRDQRRRVRALPGDRAAAGRASSRRCEPTVSAVAVR